MYICVKQNINTMQNLLISFSGGRSSAFMCKLIQEAPYYKDYNKLFIFANTGKEHEATLNFTHECDTRFDLGLIWIEADITHEKGIGTNYKLIDYSTASRNGEPFAEVIKKYGLPSKYYRHCTRELKEVPIHKYAKEYFKGEPYLTAIGIRADEKHRLSKDPDKVYPLDQFGISEMTVRNFWDRQDFDLALKDYEGNCDLCFLKSLRKKLTLLKNDPSMADWWDKQEERYATESQSKFDALRSLTIKDLLDMKDSPFVEAVDKLDMLRKQPRLFDLDMDLEFDCFCKAN